MASPVDKIVEKIPFFDGTFRRRFTAGGLIVLPTVLFAITHYGISISTFGKLEVKDILTSPMLAFGLLILIYAIGNLVEMLGEIFIIRIAGNVVWAFWVPLRLLSKSPRLVRYLARTLLWYPGFAFLFSYYGLKGMIGISDYKWDRLSESLSPDAQCLFDKLPSIVKRSLQEPFGNYGDIAWRYFKASSSQTQREWLSKIESRNKDILAIITALTIMYIFAIIIVGILLGDQDANIEKNIFMLQGLFIVPSFLFMGYFLILRKSILELLELFSITQSGESVYGSQTLQN